MEHFITVLWLFLPNCGREEILVQLHYIKSNIIWCFWDLAEEGVRLNYHSKKSLFERKRWKIEVVFCSKSSENTIEKPSEEKEISNIFSVKDYSTCLNMTSKISRKMLKTFIKIYILILHKKAASILDIYSWYGRALVSNWYSTILQHIFSCTLW